ncbi:Serine/threonine-protein kinase [Pichia californica]|nr:Serine/threonine-protein kinase [[Candida] californica]
MEIGRGSFANVYKGTDLNCNSNDNTVAIKSVFRSRLKNQKLITNLEIEIKILRNLKNPHIVSLLDCVKTDQYFHLIMDYCALGDLSYFIKKRNQLENQHPIIKSVLEKYPSPKNSNGLNEILVINFIKQLSSALKFLRSQNLIHRDIKPQNLLLCSPVHSKIDFLNNNYVGIWDLPILKVADFGFARYLPSTSMAETLCGSPLYMAPEILRYEKYNAKADLWSVGTVIYEMIVGKAPFRAQNHIELLKKIEKSNDEIIFPNDYLISPELIGLICNLLKANPIDRIGFNEFFNHPIVISNNEQFNDDMNDNSISSYSIDNEQMYVSEYLNDNNNSIKDTPIKTNNLVQPLNKMIIKEDNEDELLNNTTLKNPSLKIVSNPSKDLVNKSLKSLVSNGIVTKENIESDVKPKSMEKSVEELLQEQKISIKPNKVVLNDNKNKKTSKFKNDLIVEKDYVVIEKRNVEINTFADEIKKVSNNPTKSSDRNSFSKQRRYSMSVSPSGALKEVLDYTTEKLFGVTNIPVNDNIISNVKLNHLQSNNNNNNNNNKSNGKEEFNNEIKNNEVDINKMILNSKNHKSLIYKDINDKEDIIIIKKIENLAMMSHAISLYADIKFDQVIPLPPSSKNDDYENNNENKEYLQQYNSIYRKLCCEGLILYLKTLSLLSKAIKISSEWISNNEFKNNVIPRMGELIQWIRNRFNESLDRGEYLKLRLNKFEEEFEDCNDEYNLENFICEKILFDRAIEISKDTAIKELNFSNNITELKKCEISYSISIWMLESLLGNENGKFEETQDNDNDEKEEEEEEEEEILDKGDQIIVENFINSIGTRLLILRSKIDRQLEMGKMN